MSCFFFIRALMVVKAATRNSRPQSTRASIVLGTSISILFPTRHRNNPTSVIRTLDTRFSRLHSCALKIPFVAFLQRQPGCLPILFLALGLHLTILAFSIPFKVLIKRISAWETLNLIIQMIWLRPRSLAERMSTLMQDRPLPQHYVLYQWASQMRLMTKLRSQMLIAFLAFMIGFVFV